MTIGVGERPRGRTKKGSMRGGRRGGVLRR